MADLAFVQDHLHSVDVVLGTLCSIKRQQCGSRLLHAALTRAGASPFASALPTSDAFRRFIEAAQRRRAAGDYACFAVVPENSEPAVGWFQVRSLEPRFKTA
jgi:hypothetical protein